MAPRLTSHHQPEDLSFFTDLIFYISEMHQPVLLLLVGLLANPTSILGSCVVSPTVKDGSSTVVFTFTPTPTDILTTAGMGDNKSPMAVINLLQSYTDVATGVMKSMTTMSKMMFPMAPVPTCRFYWITNQMFCDNIKSNLIKPLCDVNSLISNVSLPVNTPLPNFPVVAPTCENDTNSRPWGLEKINAPAVWGLGFSGKGVVVANVDSGVRATHSELRDNMRPTYNWYDPYNISPNTPTDNLGHGTHTMGTMVGKTVGVAPAATWIACRGCGGSGGSCDNEQLLACGQWLACPDNKAKNCTTRPDIINNSWGGGVGNTMYLGVLSTWKALGITYFFSSGNSGPSCSTVASPADSNYTVYGHMSVGSTSCSDEISSFSSTGPSQAADYMGGLGVQIVVPGTNVRSAWSTADDSYNTISGTSMSAPHASGAAAVLLSQARANGKVMTAEAIYATMRNTATRNANITNVLMACGGNGLDLTSTYPNNKYGYGRVDLLAAVQASM